MELTYREYTGDNFWKGSKGIRESVQWICRYPVAASSIMCIALIVVSHGHRHASPPTNAAVRVARTTKQLSGSQAKVSRPVPVGPFDRLVRL